MKKIAFQFARNVQRVFAEFLFDPFKPKRKPQKKAPRNKSKGPAPENKMNG